MNVPEYLGDGAWETARRLLSIVFRLLIDTGGQSIGIRFGADTLSFSASATTATATTVTHGLGKTPQLILAFPTLGTEYIVANYVSGSRSDASFQVKGQTASGSSITANIGFFWIVVG